MSLCRRPILVFLMLAGLALAVGGRPARAETIPAAYTRLFKQGVKHYRSGSYAAALDRFKAAARVRRRTNAVLNIAQCHRMLGHRREAIKHYREYLEAWKLQHPDQESRYHGEVLQHIRTLEAGLIEPPPPPPALPPAALPAKGPSPAPPSVPFYKKWWFWTAVGVVVVGTVTATTVALQPEPRDTVTGTLGPGTYQLP